MNKAALVITCLLSLGSASARANEPAPAGDGVEKRIPMSVETPLNGLGLAIIAGQEKACAPTHLTVSGPTASGKRFYASAPLADFARAARDSSRSGAKLSQQQARSIDRLGKLSLESVRTGRGFSQALLDNAARETGLSVEAQVLCLSSERQRSR